jgi:hypothetical protein
VFGNRVGTDKLGTSELPNGIGVLIADATRTTLGHSAQPDTISGNVCDLCIDASSGTLVRYERIGTTTLGNAKPRPYRGTLPFGDLYGQRLGGLPNVPAINTHDGYGIAVLGDSKKTTIGDGTVISGITHHGSIALDLADPTIVDSTKIGVGANGKTAVRNADYGIMVSGDHADGTAISDSLIAHNKTGVYVDDSAKRTLIRLNSIYDNTDGGIIDHTEATPVAPELSDAHLLKYGIAITFKVSFSLDKGTIDFYATPSCEKGGAGRKWVGKENVDTSIKKTTGLLAREPVGTAITATLTTNQRGTSEFSKCADLAPAPKH